MEEHERLPTAMLYPDGMELCRKKAPWAHPTALTMPPIHARRARWWPLTFVITPLSRKEYR